MSKSPQQGGDIRKQGAASAAEFLSRIYSQQAMQDEVGDSVAVGPLSGHV